MSDPIDDLTKLGRLLDQRKLSQTEYDLLKKDLLADRSPDQLEHPEDGPQANKASPIQVAIGVLIALLVAFFVYSMLSGQDGDGNQAPTGQSEARQQAVADTGSGKPSEFTVSQYEAALAELEDTCELEAGQTHGMLALNTSRLLSDDGVTFSALQMLDAMSEAADSMRSAEIPCTEAYATVAVLILQDSR